MDYKGTYVSGHFRPQIGIPDIICHLEALTFTFDKDIFKLVFLFEKDDNEREIQDDLELYLNMTILLIIRELC